MTSGPWAGAGKGIAAAVLLVVLISGPALAQEANDPPEAEEFSFDPDEFKKSPWTLDGYVQGDFAYARLNREAALYRLAFLGKEGDSYRLEGGAEVQAALAFQSGSFRAYTLGVLQQTYNGERWDLEPFLFEGNLSWQAGSTAYLTLGKTLLRWGKGYAWNPTNFVGRDKNPADPDLSLEGYWMSLADIVKSFSGPLRTVAFTGLVLPVSDDINAGFSERSHANLAGKLYLLLYDTDIDLMALSGGSRSPRYGIAASRNISSNLEVHGEAALVVDFRKPIIDAEGNVTPEVYDAKNLLLGTRYLAPTNTTLIFEYYHNGRGYTGEEAADVFHFIDVAADSHLTAARPELSAYQVPNFMRNYLYLRASQKEPFGWLYVTPALFTILNLDDGSFNLVPEIIYTGIENLELRSRLNVLSGGSGTEYGEKVNDWKMEVRARYFF